MAVGRLAALGSIVCLLALHAAAGEAPLQIATEESPPMNYMQNGQVTGEATDLIRAVAERAAVPISIELLPWLRAYQRAIDQPNSCVYSTTITEERKSLFKWVGPIGQNEWVIYGRTDSPIVLHTVEDAKPFELGVYNGDVRVDYFEELGGYHLSIAPDFIGAVRQLSAGHSDLLAGDRSVQVFAKREGITNLKPLLVIKRVPVALACNRAVPDTTIDKLQAALNEMEADGKAEEIRRTYRSGL
jgi:polar amino acid transport system substrate-binding protein